MYGTKYQLENDPHGERIDDPLTPQDERYDCGDPGNCYFDIEDDPIMYEWTVLNATETCTVNPEQVSKNVTLIEAKE